MVAKCLDGENIINQIKTRAIAEIQQMPSPPKLVSLLVGSDRGAYHYAKVQKKACEQVGIHFYLKKFPDGVSQDVVIKAIHKLNNDDSVTGIMLFVPVCPGIHVETLIQHISPDKDVEGITPTNMGKLFYGDHAIAPCAPKAIMLLLESTGVSLKSQEVVVVSHNPIVGQPLLIMLLKSEWESPTPTCCHIATEDLSFHTKRADILIVAAGKAGLVDGNMIKPGAIVLDVGINIVKINGATQVVGDVEFTSAQRVASWITPVPGGVGPVTTSVLLDNVRILAQRKYARLCAS